MTGELAWWRLWAIGVEITPGRLTRRLAVEPDVGANPLGYIVTQIGKEQLDQRLTRLACGRFLDPRTYGFDVREDQNSSWPDRLLCALAQCPRDVRPGDPANPDETLEPRSLAPLFADSIAQTSHSRLLDGVGVREMRRPVTMLLLAPPLLVKQQCPLTPERP